MIQDFIVPNNVPVKAVNPRAILKLEGFGKLKIQCPYQESSPNFLPVFKSPDHTQSNETKRS
jgi:hypothetical protein